MLPLPAIVLPVDPDSLLVRGRLKPEQERKDGPFAANGLVTEAIALALAVEGQRLGRQRRLLANLAPGRGERGSIGGVNAAGDWGEVVSAEVGSASFF